MTVQPTNSATRVRRMSNLTHANSYLVSSEMIQIQNTQQETLLEQVLLYVEALAEPRRPTDAYLVPMSPHYPDFAPAPYQGTLIRGFTCCFRVAPCRWERSMRGGGPQLLVPKPAVAWGPFKMFIGILG